MGAWCRLLWMMVQIFVYCFFTGILEEILVQTCCFNCTKLRIYPPAGYIEKFYYISQVDILIPIEGGTQSRMFFDLPFFPLADQKSIAFIGKTPHKPDIDLLDILFHAVIHSWPLVLLAITLAFTAGSIIWVLVSQCGFIPLHFNCLSVLI